MAAARKPAPKKGGKPNPFVKKDDKKPGDKGKAPAKKGKPTK